MKIKFLAGALIFLILVNLAALGSYVYFRLQHKPLPVPGIPPPREMHENSGPGERPARLSSSQQEKLKNLLDQFKDETIAFHDQIKADEDRVFEYLQKKNVPDDSVDSKLKEISELHYKIDKNITGKMIEAKKFLSADQQRLFFNSIMNEGPGRPGMPPGDHRRPGPPPERR